MLYPLYKYSHVPTVIMFMDSSIFLYLRFVFKFNIQTNKQIDRQINRQIEINK